MKRVGWPTLAAVLMGFAAGFAASHVGPISRLAQLRLDSARIANAAADSANVLAANRYGVERESLGLLFTASLARYQDRMQRTAAAQRGVRTVIDTLLVQAPDSLKPLVQALADSVGTMVLAHAAEQEGARQALSASEARYQASDLEVTRLRDAVTALQVSRDGGLLREAALLRRKPFPVQVGPGVAFTAEGVRPALAVIVRLPLPRLRVPRIF